MPEISRFYGIVIKMFYGDHLPPHFHAQYSEYEAIINIYTLGIISGNLPPRAQGLVIEWANIHKDKLLADWEKAKNQEKLDKIPPLD